MTRSRSCSMALEGRSPQVRSSGRLLEPHRLLRPAFPPALARLLRHAWLTEQIHSYGGGAPARHSRRVSPCSPGPLASKCTERCTSRGDVRGLAQPHVMPAAERRTYAGPLVGASALQRWFRKAARRLGGAAMFTLSRSSPPRRTTPAPAAAPRHDRVGPRRSTAVDRGGTRIDHQHIQAPRDQPSWAWIAVIATVLMMSCTSAPRDKSLIGLRSPCSTGPIATAPALRWTAL